MSFGKWLRQGALFTAALAAIYLGGCRKSNGIENNTVIQTPFGLFFSDAEGALYNTNGGTTVKLPFPADGFSMRSIVVAGLNVLFVKSNLHISTNNAQNFNVVDTTDLKKCIFESLILNVPSHNRVYLCIDSFPTRGIKFSEDFGKTWMVDTAFDTSVHAPYGPSSFAQIGDGGDLFNYNNRSGELSKRTSKTDRWFLVRNPNGLDTSKHYFLSHFNSALIAADTNGRILYSGDGGRNFFTYPGLPPGTKVYSVGAPFGQVLLAGTVGAGVYRLSSGQFVASNNGLVPNTTVYSITGKDDTYKNGVIKQYMYIATNTGLYRSEDGGQNWTLQFPGDIRRLQ